MKKSFLIFAAAFLAIISSWNLCAQNKEFVIIEPEHPHDLNPQTTSYSSDAEILSGLYEGLFSYDPVTLDPKYAICIEYKVSRDKKRMTFILRQDAKFSNGESITADSVRDSWIQLLSTPNAPYASMLDIVRGAQAFRLGEGSVEDVGIYATDKYSLSVYLTTPANYLPKILCHSSFSVVHRIPTVYSGAFQLYDQQTGMLVLTKNPYYWDAANVPSDSITFYQSNNADDNAFYYNTGIADWVSSDIDTNKVLDKTSFQMYAEFATSYYFFKTSAKKHGKKSGVANKDGQIINPWDYADFRNALMEAMPWDVLRSNQVVAAPTLVYPIGDYPQLDGFSYTDNIEAKNLMKDARKKFGIPEDEILPLKFDLSEFSLTDEKMDALKNAFEPLGVQITFNTMPSSVYFSNVSSSDADMFIYTWIGDFADPLAFLMLFQGGSTLNDSGWQNDEFDSLIYQAACAADSQRSQLLSQAEQILLDSGIVVPVFHPISFNVIDITEVGGWSANAFDLHPLKYLYRKEPVSAVPGVVKK